MNQHEDTEEGLLLTKTTMSANLCCQAGAVSPEQELQTQDSPELCCVSLKSHHSMGIPVSFSRQTAAPQKQAADSAAPSCVSDCSKEPPLSFADRLHSVDHRTSESSCSQPGQPQQPDLDSIFMLLEENVITFVRDELKKFQRILRRNYSGLSEKWKENEDEEDRRSSREALVKITQHFLRTMKQNELADCLQNRTSAAMCQYKVKSDLKETFQHLFEGITKAGNPTPLNQIYTELYVTEGGTGEVKEEHEVRRIEMTSRRYARLEKTIQCKEMFLVLSGRTVLTKGVAGIGKTVLAQKFTLDWAENKANQDIQFAFPFTFRQLNVIKEKRFSLVELIHLFFPRTKESGISRFEEFQVVFIFDGLDECRLPLDFRNNEILTDVTESTSVDVLLTNLIRGNLLPSARLWITTRPAAANQIPPECVDMVTEVRGFTDPQKEEYFKKKFRDEEQASRIISHIKTSRSLHIMCHIPVFCWISATVLEVLLETRKGGELPKTLTEMYIHLLVVQTKLKNIKYDGGAETDPHWSPENKKMIESLGKLAFEQLQKGNLIFYESDLTECGIDIRAASVYSGVFTQIFKEERGLYQDKVFCFIHLSVQEFLAALHVHLTFFNSGVNLMSEEQLTTPRSVSETVTLYRSAVDRALQNPNGHLDLFLRFLLGLSLETNQSLLQGLLTHTEQTSWANRQIILYIQRSIGENISPERSINLFHCLNELKDSSLVEEIQHRLSSGNLSAHQLSPSQWSALVFILVSSEKDLDVFDLKKYSASEEGLLWLLPVVKASSKSLLSGCNLLERSCKVLAPILSSQLSNLIELDLRYNNPQDSGVKLLCTELQSPNCNLKTLRLNGCGLSWRICKVLKLQSSSLRELDLSNNNLQDPGVTDLSTGLKSPHCTLKILRLSSCNISNEGCEALASVFNSQPCSLRELDLSNNDLQDSGVKLFCNGLQSPHCQLETLSLSGCQLTEKGCASLVSALTSNPFHLKELDLSYNNPGDLGVGLLSTYPHCRLDLVRNYFGGVQRLKPGLGKYACELTMDPNTAHRNLWLLENIVTFEQEEFSYPYQSDRFDSWYQLLCINGLRGRCYWEVNWIGLVSIGVAYREIKRTGWSEDSCIGANDKSWSLECSPDRYSAWHNNEVRVIRKPAPCSEWNRVAVYLDWPAGTVSFYKVSDTLTHIHTFHSTFTDALYPAFRIRSEFTYRQFNLLSLCHTGEED